MPDPFSLFESQQQSQSVTQATQAQQAESQNAINLQQQAMQQAQANYNQQWQAEQPFLQQGTAAVNQLGPNVLSGQYGQQYTLGDFMQGPAYQSMLGADQQLLQQAPAQYAASGMLGSGNMQSGLQNQAQLNALQSEGVGYNQWQGATQMGLDSLQSLAGLGQSTNNSLGGLMTSQNQLAQSSASTIGNLDLGMGNILASGALAQGNIISNLAQGLSGGSNQALGSYMNQFQNQQLMSQMFGNQQAGGSQLTQGDVSMSDLGI